LFEGAKIEIGNRLHKLAPSGRVFLFAQLDVAGAKHLNRRVNMLASLGTQHVPQQIPKKLHAFAQLPVRGKLKVVRFVQGFVCC
jgi:hypothetical protein